MNKDLFISVLNNKSLNNVIFKYVGIVGLQVTGDRSAKSFKWSEFVDRPYLLALYNKLDLLKEWFEANKNNGRARCFTAWPRNGNVRAIIKNAVCGGGSIEMLRFLMDYFKIDESTPISGEDPINSTTLNTLLQFAAEHNRMDFIDYLLSQFPTFSWNYLDAMDIAPLSKNIEILKFMVEKCNSAGLNQENHQFGNVFDNASTVAGLDALEMIKYLLKERPQDQKECNILTNAMLGRNIELIKYVLQNIEQFREEFPAEGYGYNHVQMALSTSNTEIVKLMVEPNNCKVKFNFVREAAMKGNIELMRWHHERGNSRDPIIMEFLPNFETIQWLTGHGYQLTTNLKTTVNVLIENTGSSAPADNLDKHWSDFLNLVDYLHEYHSDGFNEGAMDTAATFGALNVVQFLHKYRTEGCTNDALDMAAANGHLETVKFLHENRTERCTRRAMDFAAENGHLEMVRFLHENRTEGCTNYAIDMAAMNGHKEVVQFLHENRSEYITMSGLDLFYNGIWDINMIKYIKKDERAKKNEREFLKFQHFLSNTNMDIDLEAIKWIHENEKELSNYLNNLDLFIPYNHHLIIDWVINTYETPYSTLIQKLEQYKTEHPYSTQSIQVIENHIGKYK